MDDSEHELEDGEEKAALMLAICRQYPSFGRGYFKVDPKQVTLEQARELAARYPVFMIETAQRRTQEVSKHYG